MKQPQKPQLDTSKIIEQLFDGIEISMRAKRLVQAHRTSGFMSRSVQFSGTIEDMDIMANKTIDFFNQSSRIIRGIPVRMLLGKTEQSVRLHEFVPGETVSLRFSYHPDNADPSTTIFGSVDELRQAFRAQSEYDHGPMGII